MSALAASLRELHRIHQQLSDLRDRLRRGPKQVEAHTVNVTRLEADLAAAQAQLKAGKVAVDQKQLLLKSSEGKVLDLKAKLNSANNNREYQALLEQIAATEMAGSVLADEILEALEQVDAFQAQIGEAQTKLAKGKEELARATDAVAAQAGELKNEVTRLEAELREAEGVLPADVRETYNRMVKSKGSDCMAKLESDSCGGCYQQLTPNMINSLQLGHMVFCKSCGRLLYTPEDLSIGGAR
ncbi:MAG: hypothetical protein JNG90_10730 [Planctomycetaceae bacterium]|nr:hypothetical protein [Planctomycetaceae bacterium]